MTQTANHPDPIHSRPPMESYFITDLFNHPGTEILTLPEAFRVVPDPVLEDQLHHLVGTLLLVDLLAFLVVLPAIAQSLCGAGCGPVGSTGWFYTNCMNATSTDILITDDA